MVPGRSPLIATTTTRLQNEFGGICSWGAVFPRRFGFSMKGGGHMGMSTPGFSVGCGMLGVFNLSSTAIEAGELVPAPRMKPLNDNDGWKNDRPPPQVGSN
jgi:hypothetical protein